MDSGGGSNFFPYSTQKFFEPCFQDVSIKTLITGDSYTAETRTIQSESTWRVLMNCLMFAIGFSNKACSKTQTNSNVRFMRLRSCTCPKCAEDSFFNQKIESNRFFWMWTCASGIIQEKRAGQRSESTPRTSPELSTWIHSTIIRGNGSWNLATGFLTQKWSL